MPNSSGFPTYSLTVELTSHSQSRDYGVKCGLVRLVRSNWCAANGEPMRSGSLHVGPGSNSSLGVECGWARFAGGRCRPAVLADASGDIAKSCCCSRDSS